MDEEDEKEGSDYVISSSTGDSLLQDTTVKEKSNVFKISKRISRYLSGLLFATGAISILMSAEYFVGSRLLTVFELKTLFLFVLGFIGTVNLVCGLLLLTKE